MNLVISFIQKNYNQKKKKWLNSSWNSIPTTKHLKLERTMNLIQIP